MRDMRPLLEAKLGCNRARAPSVVRRPARPVGRRSRRDGPGVCAPSAPWRSSRPGPHGSRHAPTRASLRGMFRPGCSKCPTRSPRRPRRDRRRASPHAASCRRIRARPASCCSGRRRRMISLPTSVEPVKATMSTSGWSASGLPAFSPKPGTILSTPRGSPASSARRAERQRAERRLLRRLQDDRIACDQRRAELPRADDERIVPRHDRADDAEGLLARPWRRHARRPARPRRRACRRIRRNIECSWRKRGHRRPANCRSPCRRRASPGARSRRRCSRMSSAKRNSTCFFFWGSASRQTPLSKAARAAFTARSTSASPQSATCGENLSVDRRDPGEGRAVEGGDIGAVDEGAAFNIERCGSGEPAFARGGTIEHV